MRSRHTWTLPRSALELGARTAVMGILNITPDSFSDGGDYFDGDQAVTRGKEIEQEGADILDIGGQSTRPGSEPVTEEEEARRVLPVIQALSNAVKIPLSIDTYLAGIARRAIEVGAQIVNDISGFRFDSAMPDVVKKAGAGVVLMHSRGSRETLHRQARMEDPVREVAEGLAAAVEKAIGAGIRQGAIVVDPGIGFGKAAEESFKVLKSLSEFSKLGYPLLVGTSRKSFVRMIAREPSEARTWGTAATVVVAIMNGAHVVRVHDVGAARVLADVTDRLT